MRVRVKLLSSLRQLLPAECRGEQTLELPDGATLADVVAALPFEEHFGAQALQGGLGNVAQTLVNQTFEGSLKRPLADGDEVVFIPPIVGGCVFPIF